MPAVTLWATLSQGGALGANSGAAAASGTQPYTVTSNRDIRDCAVLAASNGQYLQAVISGVIKNGRTAHIYVIDRGTGGFAAASVSVAAFC